MIEGERTGQKGAHSCACERKFCVVARPDSMLTGAKVTLRFRIDRMIILARACTKFELKHCRIIRYEPKLSLLRDGGRKVVRLNLTRTIFPQGAGIHTQTFPHKLQPFLTFSYII